MITKEEGAQKEINELIKMGHSASIDELDMLKSFYISGWDERDKESGWIDVNEQLPEIGQRVLCIDNDGFVEIANYVIEPVWNSGKKTPCFLDEQDEQPGVCYPTHWQPIPTLKK